MGYSGLGLNLNFLRLSYMRVYAPLGSASSYLRWATASRTAVSAIRV